MMIPGNSAIHESNMFVADHDYARRSWGTGDHLLRVRGALLGGALGDALGYGRNRTASNQSASSLGSLDLLAILQQSGGLASEYTQLTLFSCEAMLRGTVRAVEYNWGADKRSSWGGSHNYVLTARSYLRWLHTQDGYDRFAKSVPCSDAPGWLLHHPLLHHTRPVGDASTRQALHRMLENSDLKSGASVTNAVEDAGAVVRAAPFGLACVSERFEVAHDSARITHYRSNSRTTAAAYAILLDHLLAGGLELAQAVTETIRALGDHPKSHATATALREAEACLRCGGEPTGDSLATPRTPAEALAYAIRCAGAHDFASALVHALGHAGDITATAAITGTLFGVQHGALALPGDLIVRLELAEVVREVADDLVIGYDPNTAWWDRYPGC
jgi:ADP-ribosylglycohydrolase